MIEFVARIGDNVALHRSSSVGSRYLQGVQFENILDVQTVCRFRTPEQFQVRRQHLFGHIAIDEFVDGRRIANIGIAHHAQGVATRGL